MKQVNTSYKMNEIVNKFLIAGDKLVPQIDLRQPAALDKADIKNSTSYTSLIFLEVSPPYSSL